MKLDTRAWIAASWSSVPVHLFSLGCNDHGFLVKGRLDATLVISGLRAVETITHSGYILSPCGWFGGRTHQAFPSLPGSCISQPRPGALGHLSIFSSKVRAVGGPPLRPGGHRWPGHRGHSDAKNKTPPPDNKKLFAACAELLCATFFLASPCLTWVWTFSLFGFLPLLAKYDLHAHG